MKTFSFSEQKTVEESGTAKVDAHFSERYQIAPASPDDERRGIDRWFTDKRTGERSSVQYKIDMVACRSHNAFIETISVERTGHPLVPGWAHTCAADWLMYYVHGDDLIYVLRPDQVRSQLVLWRGIYRIARVPNRDRSGRLDYFTHGIIVPLAELERIADAVFCV